MVANSLLSAFSSLLSGGKIARQFTGGTPQESSIIQRTEKETPLEEVNTVVREASQQELNQLHAAEKQAVTTQAITPEIIDNGGAGHLTLNKQSNQDSPAITLGISHTTVENLKPILLAFTDLVKNLLPELVATAKPVLQALSQASSNPANTASTAANTA
jgi:hypothetical protein